MHLISKIVTNQNQTIRTRSSLSFLILTDFSVHFSLLSCTDLFINLTILPFGPWILDPGESSVVESSSLVSASPPVIRSHKSAMLSCHPASSQSVTESPSSFTCRNRVCKIVCSQCLQQDLYLVIAWSHGYNSVGKGRTQYVKQD